MVDSSQNPIASEPKLLWTVVVISVTATFFLGIVPERTWVFSDTAHYMSTARMIMEGKGIQTDLIYYGEQTRAGTIPAPQTVFPPGYSIVVAAGSKLTGANHHELARWLCLTAYAFVAPLIFLLGIEIRLPQHTAAICAVIWITIAETWMSTWCYSSDIPFLVLTLSSMLFFIRSNDRTAGLLMAGILAAVAISWRYAGIFLGIAYGVALLFQHRGRLLPTIRSGMFAIAPAVLMTLLLFARNQSLAGTWRGGNNYVGQPVDLVLKTAYYCLCSLTGFSLKGLVALEFTCVTQVVIGTMVLGAAMALLFRDKTRLFREALSSRAAVALVYTPITIAMLIYLHATKSSGMSTRLFIPIIPTALLALGLLYEQYAARSRRVRIIASAVGLVGIAVVVMGQPECLAGNRALAARGVATRIILDQPVAAGSSTTLGQYLRAHCDQQHALLSSMPQMTHLFVEQPSIGLPTSYFNTLNEPWTSKRVQDVVIRPYSVRYVLLLTHPDTSNHGSEFFKDLQAGDRPEWLTVVFQQDDFTLFTVNDAP